MFLDGESNFECQRHQIFICPVDDDDGLTIENELGTFVFVLLVKCITVRHLATLPNHYVLSNVLGVYFTTKKDCNYLLGQNFTLLGRSPGLVVSGGDSCSRGRGLES